MAGVATGKDYERLWRAVTTCTEAETVQALSEILADEGGKSFILHLERNQAESCIRILDHVSCDIRSLPFRNLR